MSNGSTTRHTTGVGVAAGLITIVGLVTGGAVIGYNIADTSKQGVVLLDCGQKGGPDKARGTIYLAQGAKVNMEGDDMVATPLGLRDITKNPLTKPSPEASGAGAKATPAPQESLQNPIRLHTGDALFGGHPKDTAISWRVANPTEVKAGFVPAGGLRLDITESCTGRRSGALGDGFRKPTYVATGEVTAYANFPGRRR